MIGRSTRPSDSGPIAESLPEIACARTSKPRRTRPTLPRGLSL